MVTKRLQYRYDAVGNKVGMTDADGGLFTYTYDVMRRLTGVINPLGERTTYVYDLNGRRTSVQLANGTRTSYSYDQGSRVQQIHTLKSNNSTVAKFDYAYDNNGRRTSVLEADGSRVTWTYDGTSQVTSEWRTGTSPFRHTFVYDTRGNRTLKVEDGARTTLVYDAANQLSSSEDAGGTTTYTYDGNGNQHATVAPGGSRTTQIWDYENRLVKTLQPGGGVSTMAYDADGLRVRKETPSETKLFVWDDQNYLAETDDSGVTEVAYTTEPSLYGNLVSHQSGGTMTVYHFDALAAARVLTNSSESVLESYNYTAFGTILGTPTLLTPLLWGGLVGYYWDADLGSQYIRARYYQPHIARWISLDPIGFAGGDANLFRYVGNSPTSGATSPQIKLSVSSHGHLHLSIATKVLWRFPHVGMPRLGVNGTSFHAYIEYLSSFSLHAQRFSKDGIDPTGYHAFCTVDENYDYVIKEYFPGIWPDPFDNYMLEMDYELPSGSCGSFEYKYTCSGKYLLWSTELIPDGCSNRMGPSRHLYPGFVCSGSTGCIFPDLCVDAIQINITIPHRYTIVPVVELTGFGIPSCLKLVAAGCATSFSGKVGHCGQPKCPPPPPLPTPIPPPPLPEVDWPPGTDDLPDLFK